MLSQNSSLTVVDFSGDTLMAIRLASLLKGDEFCDTYCLQTKDQTNCFHLLSRFQLEYGPIRFQLEYSLIIDSDNHLLIYKFWGFSNKEYI